MNGGRADTISAMKPNTHLEIDPTLCGRVLDLSEGRARVALEATAAMTADDRGLVHGGFVFGAADYAAMLAVNDPNVVLGSADVRFTRPVVSGETVVAEAKVAEGSGKKRLVDVRVRRGTEPDGEVVCEGRLTCFVLPRHVLDP